MTLSADYKFKEIALAIRVGVPHLERFAQGVRKYAVTQANWRFILSPETHDLPPSSLDGWNGDGVIALCNTAEDLRVLSSLDCPVVNISGAIADSRFPRVHNDYRQIGAHGATYLRERGFRRLCFYGIEGVWYSEQIEDGFREASSLLGGKAEVLRCPNMMGEGRIWDHGQDELELWLLSIERPFAVMAAHDPRAALVVGACERIGLRVPEDVAVLGSNDDTVSCETCNPTLSSIDRNSREVGRRAAQMLDRLIQGKPTPHELIVPHGDVHERKSTLTFGVEHNAIRKAIDYIELRFAEPIGVEQIANASGKSRRWLESRFKEEVQCSPAEFLRQVRVKRAIQLLDTQHSIPRRALAAECGFSGTRQLNSVFSKSTGMSVRQYLSSQSIESGGG